MALSLGFARNSPMAPLDMRLIHKAMVAANADGSPRVGVLGSNGSDLVTALGTMHVRVALADFVTSKGASDGVFVFGNGGPVDVTIQPAPLANSRIDVIWVKYFDSTTTDASTGPQFGVTSGAAAAAPAKPALPLGALELATLRVYAGTTSANGGSNTLINTFAMTGLRDTVLRMRTKVELDDWASASPGQEVYVISEATTYKRNQAGDAWQLWERGWTTYAPTLTNMTVTAPNTKAKYKVQAGRCTVRVRFLVSTMGTNPSFTLPLPAFDAALEHVNGNVALIPGSGSEVIGVIRRPNATSVILYFQWVSSATVYLNNITASAPFTWASSGTIAADLEYDLAA